ncbi:MAG: choline monooxygenase [Saprospiraceae bacterium]|jgi:choline monooxygenase
MNSTATCLKSRIEEAELQSVFQPIATATGLPNKTYTDQVLFEFERDNILAKTWVAVAFIDEFSQGDIRPQSFMGVPIVITRSKEGAINVFHNVCSHRGMQLVDKPTNSNGLIVCPYHSWTYNVEGDLVATPHIGGIGVHTHPDVCNKERGLKEIRSHSWMGILFINLSGEAPAFEVDARDAIERANAFMGDSGEAMLRAPKEVSDNMSITLQANWKFAIENYLEAYHLPSIHPGLNSYSPLSEHAPLVHGEKLAGQVTSTFDPQFGDGKSLPMFPDWDELEISTGDYPALYPNLLLGFQANHVFAMIIHPETPITTREEVKIFYCGDAATDADLADLREVTGVNWMEVFDEDIDPCERMQLGRSSPGYSGGAFSPTLDICSHHFHKWVANQYLAFYS